MAYKPIPAHLKPRKTATKTIHHSLAYDVTTREKLMALAKHWNLSMNATIIRSLHDAHLEHLGKRTAGRPKASVTDQNQWRPPRVGDTHSVIVYDRDGNSSVEQRVNTQEYVDEVIAKREREARGAMQPAEPAPSLKPQHPIVPLMDRTDIPAHPFAHLTDEQILSGEVDLFGDD